MVERVLCKYFRAPTGGCGLPEGGICGSQTSEIRTRKPFVTDKFELQSGMAGTEFIKCGNEYDKPTKDPSSPLT